MEYAHVFHDKETNDFKGTDVIEHQIMVGDAQPIRRTQYSPLLTEERDEGSNEENVE